MCETAIEKLSYINRQRVDVFIEDSFLAEGIKILANNVCGFYEISSPVIIFEPSRYADVMTVLNSRTKFVAIMLIENNPYPFIDIKNNLFRVKKSLTVLEMTEVLIKAICGDHDNASPCDATLILNAKEIEFVNLVRRDLNPTQISQHLCVNIKTVYALRQRLVLRLSCVNFQDFYLLCKSKVFADWLLDKHNFKKLKIQPQLRPSRH